MGGGVVDERRCAISALLALLCASCAGPVAQLPNISTDEVAAEKRRQEVVQLQTFAAQVTRVENVAHRLMVANRSDCADVVAPRMGWKILARADLHPERRDVAAEALNLDAERPTVVTVVAGGPAAKSGLLPGDVLVSIDGEQAPANRFAEWIANRLQRSGGSPLRVEFTRRGTPHVRSVQPIMGCLLTANQGTNALTDGRRIAIYTGVLRIAQTDAELAAVIGHELAHVTMRHIEKKERIRMAGGLARLLGGLAMDFRASVEADTKGEQAEPGRYTREMLQPNPFAKDFEREADYVGLYYVARADYDIAGAERIWRALAQESPQQIFYAGIHPTSPERVILLQKTAQEIAEKRRRHQPLVPEVRTSQASSPPALARNDQ